MSGLLENTVSLDLRCTLEFCTQGVDSSTHRKIRTMCSYYGNFDAERSDYHPNRKAFRETASHRGHFQWRWEPHRIAPPLDARLQITSDSWWAKEAPALFPPVPQSPLKSTAPPHRWPWSSINAIVGAKLHPTKQTRDHMKSHVKTCYMKSSRWVPEPIPVSTKSENIDSHTLHESHFLDRWRVNIQCYANPDIWITRLKLCK